LKSRLRDILQSYLADFAEIDARSADQIAWDETLYYAGAGASLQLILDSVKRGDLEKTLKRMVREIRIETSRRLKVVR
jgi:hypothetical protein